MVYLITLNFLVSTMAEILLIGCFLRHTIQSNLLCFNVSSLKCVVLISFCPFLYCEIDALCHHFNKAFMYVCMSVRESTFIHTLTVSLFVVTCTACGDPNCAVCDKYDLSECNICNDGYYRSETYECIGLIF